MIFSEEEMVNFLILTVVSCLVMDRAEQAVRLVSVMDFVLLILILS